MVGDGVNDAQPFGIYRWCSNGVVLELCNFLETADIALMSDDLISAIYNKIKS